MTIQTKEENKGALKKSTIQKYRRPMGKKKTKPQKQYYLALKALQIN